MWMIELNPFFGPLLTPLTFDQPLPGCWELVEKRSTKRWRLVTTVCWYPNPLQAAPRLWPVLTTPSIPSSSQYLYPRHSLPSTCSPISVAIEAEFSIKTEVMRWSPPQFPSPTYHPDYTCKPFLFPSQPPSLPWEALPFYPHCTYPANLFLPSSVPPLHINHLKCFSF